MSGYTECPSCPQSHARPSVHQFISSPHNCPEGPLNLLFSQLKMLSTRSWLVFILSILTSGTRTHPPGPFSLFYALSRCHSICGAELFELYLLICAILLPFLLNSTVLSKGDFSTRTGMVFTPYTQHST